MHSNEKLIIAGQFYHYYQYSQEILYDYEKKPVTFNPNRPQERAVDLSKRTDSNIYRTKKAIKLLLQANTTEQSFAKNSIQRPLFVTLTFAENVQEVGKANKLFTEFVKTLNYQTFKTKKATLHYLAVIEFQQRGAIHYHVVFFNPLDISKFYDLVHENWTHGHCHLKKIHNQTHLINYVHKDLTKLRQKKELHGHKSYFCSKGLLKPTVHRNKERISNLLPPMDKQQYIKSYTKDSLTVIYRLYKI